MVRRHGGRTNSPVVTGDLLVPILVDQKAEEGNGRTQQLSPQLRPPTPALLFNVAHIQGVTPLHS